METRSPALVRLEITGKVALVTIDNKPVNALSRSIMAQFHAVMDSVMARGSVRAVVLTGEGQRVFVAGADINELPANASEAREYVEAAHALTNRVESAGLPTVCALNGSALGGGLELALACDIRVTSVDARFGLPEIKLGLVPGAGGTQRLPHMIGAGRAQYMIMTGELVSAQSAEAWGLVDRVVPASEVLPAAMAIAQALANGAPLALSWAKRLVTAAVTTPQAGMELERQGFTQLCQTKDSREGVRAFLNRQTPNFTGQ